MNLRAVNGPLILGRLLGMGLVALVKTKNRNCLDLFKSPKRPAAHRSAKKLEKDDDVCEFTDDDWTQYDSE